MDLQSIELKHHVTERLGQVIDPETGVDVMRMRLIEDLEVDSQDRARALQVSALIAAVSPGRPL